MTSPLSQMRWISDPGHGWLEVPMVYVLASGVTVTDYSYKDDVNHLMYLEEDVDAPAFCEAYGIEPGDLQGRECFYNGQFPYCLPNGRHVKRLDGTQRPA